MKKKATTKDMADVTEIHNFVAFKGFSFKIEKIKVKGEKLPLWCFILSKGEDVVHVNLPKNVVSVEKKK